MRDGASGIAHGTRNGLALDYFRIQRGNRRSCEPGQHDDLFDRRESRPGRDQIAIVLRYASCSPERVDYERKNTHAQTVACSAMEYARRLAQ